MTGQSDGGQGRGPVSLCSAISRLVQRFGARTRGRAETERLNDRDRACKRRWPQSGAGESGFRFVRAYPWPVNLVYC